MATKKDKNPPAVEPVTPHRPPSVYQPNPFPLNPSEGNPWAKTDSNVPYLPPYHNANDYSRQDEYDRSGNEQIKRMQMPTPYGNTNYNNLYDNHNPNYHNYGQNSYDASQKENNDNYGYNEGYGNNDNYGYNEGHDNNHDNNLKPESGQTLSEVAEPEPFDPAKLNGSKVSPPIITALHNGKPNGKRLLLRFIQFLSSAGCFAFVVSAHSVSGHDTPFEDKTGLIFLYIISMLSAIVSLGFLWIYITRRFRHGEKIKRWIMLITDMFMAIVWAVDLLMLFSKSHCKPGDFNHWCDMYNTSLFWGVLALVTFITAFVWDIVGAFSKKSTMNFDA